MSSFMQHLNFRRKYNCNSIYGWTSSVIGLNQLSHRIEWFGDDADKKNLIDYKNSTKNWY